MKRFYLTIFIFSTITFAGCTDSDEQSAKDQTSEQDSSQMEQETEVESEVHTEENREQSKENHAENTEEESENGENNTEVTEPEYSVSETWSVVPIEDAKEEVVLLTIDDAPDGNALQMAETLYELKADAIFFVNGHFLNTPEDEEILKEIHDMGFFIGNHTYNHPFLPDIPEDEQTDEIIGLSDRIEEIIGERPKFFRAPNGANTDHVIKVVEEEGMTLMNWSYGYDWEEEYMSSEAIADIMVNTELLGNGANLLMHDREWTAEALGDIVQGLRDRGYEMVDPGLIE